MTDSFMGYKEDFEQCRDEAMEDIKAIADAKSKPARDECITRAEGSVAEAERYLRILESESRAGDSQERRKMHQMLRTCKSQVDKLKSLLERNKLIGDSQNRLNDRPQEMSAKEQMARYNKRLDKAGDHLNDAQQLIAQSEAIAQNITSNLQDQGDHLRNVGKNVDNVREDTKEADAHLQSLKRKHWWQIAVLYFIIFALSAHIIYRVISMVT
ncbi:hypothetical protein Poli38472_008566 [Pythium oligandrum]|uniref:t-SNARE coiled-coil homology domain-containing protein n=1 Tax=Pythium oligandrum TaxID=41045 RepID=A0A8K1FEJ3_PYTOL|nr:hypothetical protein Poli38472_008566 [Pythium oligandrum]|eukprot:TMW55918.1 hypothetical protein Poli38472_008566 [Pythium oligandrum]